MYAKCSLASLGKLHTNALIKSQSPVGLKYKPLSQIQNSVQKLKANKKMSKSKSKSKQNTPQNEKSSQRRNSISNQKSIIYFQKNTQKPKQLPLQRQSKKTAFQFSQNYNSILSSYDGSLVNNPSRISINSKNLADSNTNSCISSQYQIPMNSQFSQKNVKFSDRLLQGNMSRLDAKKSSDKEQDRLRTPSILKKKLSINSVNSQKSSSIRSVTKASRTKELMEIQNVGLNKGVKSKFEGLFKKYEDLNKRYAKNLMKNYERLQKYTDDIFPPQNSSIFSYSIHSKNQNLKDIEWKRIPQIYSEQTLVVLREQSSKSLIKVTKNNLKRQSSLVEDYFVTSLNCIRQNKKLLETMFQIKQINYSGIYLLKIFQEKAWKYVIVDDFVPVIYDQTKQKHSPAFINVQKAEGNTSDSVQIWPFLLEKAYAAYYSKYQALKYGTEIDFLQQLTGVSARQIKIPKINFQAKEHLQFENLLRQERGIILGQKIVEEKSLFYCIIPDLNSITKKSQGFCTYLSSQKNYKPVKQKMQVFLNTLTKIYVLQLQMPLKVSFSFLCPQNKKSTEGSFKYKKEVPNSQNKQENEISLRCFTIGQSTKGVISIKQKDRRFYFQGKFQYNYIWIRAILVLKELNGDYRWIDGHYSNKKSLSFFCRLEPGEYYLLLMPQWSVSYKYDISISIHTEKLQVPIQKRLLQKNEQIFQKGCADIAQRQGSMNQINKYICAYNYVSKQAGLVIENINNQRQNGPVMVMRSINGLKCQVSLVPVNKQFYFNTSSEYDNEAARKMKKTIEVDIEANRHYTVVLKTIGGIDHKFFDSFDFGC